jgi:hypothetical protein
MKTRDNGRHPHGSWLAGRAIGARIWVAATAMGVGGAGRRRRSEAGVSLVSVVLFVVVASIVGTWWGWNHVAAAGTAIANWVHHLGGPQKAAGSPGVGH